MAGLSLNQVGPSNDPPVDVVEDTTSRSIFSLLKGIKNYNRLVSIIFGDPTDAPVVVAEDGTARSLTSILKGCKNYLRNLDGTIVIGKIQTNPTLPSDAARETKQTITNNALGLPEDVPLAGVEDNTARSIISLLKGIKNYLNSLVTNGATAAAQEEGNASLESIAGKHVGGPVVITQNSTSQQVTVPALAKGFRVSTKGGAANLNIGGAATADSVLYVPDESIDYYPITGGTHTLYCYGTAGKAYFSFLG